MSIICMLNILKKNCSAAACQCTRVPSTTKNVRVACAPSFVWQWPVGALFRWLFQHPSCCCPLQLFRVVGSHMHALLVSCPSAKRSVEPSLASMCSLDQEKVCLTDQWRAGMLGSWLFRSSSFWSSLFSQVAMDPWFMVCLSTSSLSRDLFLAG